jgi:hypothetical protein
MGALAPGGIRRLLHHPAAFALAMLACVGVALVVEPFAGRPGELAIGATTWLVLLASVRSSPPAERAQVAVVVLIASAGEPSWRPATGWCTWPGAGSRRAPPSGPTRARSSGSRCSPRRAGRPAASWARAATSRARSRRSPCSRSSCAVASRRCSPACSSSSPSSSSTAPPWGPGNGSTHVSGLHIPMANPPSGVAAGYCAFDALAPRMGQRLARYIRPRRARSSIGQSSGLII